MIFHLPTPYCSTPWRRNASSSSDQNFVFRRALSCQQQKEFPVNMPNRIIPIAVRSTLAAPTSCPSATPQRVWRLHVASLQLHSRCLDFIMQSSRQTLSESRSYNTITKTNVLTCCLRRRHVLGRLVFTSFWRGVGNGLHVIILQLPCRIVQSDCVVVIDITASIGLAGGSRYGRRFAQCFRESLQILIPTQRASARTRGTGRPWGRFLHKTGSRGVRWRGRLRRSSSRCARGGGACAPLDGSCSRTSRLSPHRRSEYKTTQERNTFRGLLVRVLSRVKTQRTCAPRYTLLLHSPRRAAAAALLSHDDSSLFAVANF